MEILQPLPSPPVFRPDSGESGTRKKKIHCKQELIVNSLQKFYTGRTDMKEVLPMLKGTSDLSLRLVDWFVTNYSKNQHVTYMTPAGRQFTVHVAYKSSLDGYSKKLFDPFCRTERIEFHGMTTTVAQLNFIRWCITNGIIDYMTTKEVLRSRQTLQASRSRSSKDAKSTGSQFEGCMCPGT